MGSKHSIEKILHLVLIDWSVNDRYSYIEVEPLNFSSEIVKK